MTVRLHIFTLCVCVSYLTLGVFDVESARNLWAVYAGTSFVLVSIALWLEQGADG